MSEPTNKIIDEAIDEAMAKSMIEELEADHTAPAEEAPVEEPQNEEAQPSTPIREYLVLTTDDLKNSVGNRIKSIETEMWNLQLTAHELQGINTPEANKIIADSMAGVSQMAQRRENMLAVYAGLNATHIPTEEAQGDMPNPSDD